MPAIFDTIHIINHK